MKTAVIIPFRDRGLDPRRAANLEVVMAWWYAHGYDPQVWGDGLVGDAQFNRHRAYNRAVSGNPDADMFVFTEADMLIHPDQIRHARARALVDVGLVLPFTQYRYLSDTTTASLRDWYHDASAEDKASVFPANEGDPASVWNITPMSTMDNGRSIGAINVISRATLEITGGFTEATHGNWYDDRIIEESFTFLTGNPTRFVNGPALHLYHLPGWTGDHLSDEDKAATKHNKALLREVRLAIRQGRKTYVRNLMEARA